MVKDKTSWLFDQSDSDADDDLNLDTDGFTETLRRGYDDGVTRDAGFNQSDFKTEFVNTVEKTEIYHSGKASAFEGASKPDQMDDPVVGWFVVVKGPGMGQSVPLGSGMNKIGRDSKERVALAFGDKLISSEDHVRVIYDDETRSFLIAPGGGANVSKVNRKIVAMPMPLENYALVELSKQTHVRFVAFCNEGFDWSDVSQDGGTSTT
jgi:hypothetical protein